MKGWFGPLRALIPADTMGRGGVLVGLFLGTVVLPLALGARQFLLRERAESEYLHEAFLAIALTQVGEPPTDDPSESDSGLRQIAELSRRVSWAGVFDAEGRGFELRRRTALPQAELAAQIDATATRPGRKPLRVDGRDSERFQLLTFPHPDTGATLAVVVDGGDLPTLGEPIPTGGWFVLAVAGLLASWTWFQFAIARPIQRFVDAVRFQNGLSALATDDLSPRELTDLAQAVVDAEQDVRRWRAEADGLRESLDARVDAGLRAANLAQRRAELAADTDALTQLQNRRAFERDMPELFRARRASYGELALVVMDVDHFKELNDTLGHQAGDNVLAFLGHLIRATLRRGQDRAVRYGGDEFVLVLPDTSASQAAATAKRLVTMFAQWARTLKGVARLPSLSAGVAELRHNPVDAWGDLLHLADEAMYAAKRGELAVAIAGASGGAVNRSSRRR